MTKILEINKLSAGYGPLRVLHEIDLSLDRGENWISGSKWSWKNYFN